MNKEEYFISEIYRKNSEYLSVQKMLQEWKYNNNITKMCIVHHRDDTDECRRYNEEHYELWGFNEDGTFEYGKYVMFMTQAEHCSYHMQGDRNPMKKPSVRAKISEINKGKVIPKEIRDKISITTKIAMQSPEIRSKISKARTGSKSSTETKLKISTASKNIITPVKEAYYIYISIGGTVKWNTFQKLFRNKDPQIMSYLV